ncbi:TPA: GTP-binding protein [Clostridium perfringens]
MSKKLSELRNDEMLLVGDSVISKENLLEEFTFYGKEYKCDIWTTTKYKANIDAYDTLENALECEYQNMYEGWFEDVLSCIEEKDIQDFQLILDRILSRGSNYCYTVAEKVEVDINISEV